MIPATFGDDRWSHGAQSFGPSLRLVAESLSLPLDSVEASGEIAVATRTTEIAAGTLEGGTVAGQRMRVSGMRGGRPLLSFVATWFCTTELEPAWDLGPTGWRISVVGDAPLEVEMRFAVPLESMGDWTPGYTANRAVNAVPFVCQAEPGIRTSVDLPQIIGTLRQGPVDRRARRSDRMRPLPELTPATEWFWTSGADGRLRIQGCTDCGSLVHPPVPICPVCRSRQSEPTVVSGRGTIIGYTVNHHQWSPDFAPPYALAVVALAEDPSVRLTTRIVGCDPDEVAIGQEVTVRFEQLRGRLAPPLRAHRRGGGG